MFNFKKSMIVAIAFLFIGFSLSFVSARDEMHRSEIGNINDDLLGYWNFDEDSNQINDDSGNGHQAINNGATWISEGLIGGAFSFDGLNDYIEIPDTKDFEFSNEDISYSAWIQIKDNSDRYYPIIALNDYDDNAPAYLLMKGRRGNANGAIYTKLRNEESIDTSSYSKSDGDQLPKNTWLFLTSVIDYSESYKLKLYINGVLQSNNSLVDFDFSNSDDLYLSIGARAGIYGIPYEEFFYGLIDEVRIYKKALTQDEIEELFEEPFENFLMFGKITNLNTEPENIISFEAEKLRLIQFSPFQFLQYQSNEKAIVLKCYIGIVTPNRILGFFKINI